MKNFEFTTTFSSTLKPLVAEERDKYLALASLDKIGSFIPDVDGDDIDLLPIAFNACVVNRANKNGDVLDTKTSIAVYKNFINKPINIEHNRNRVVGVILTAGFSEFGTDKPLQEEDVKHSNSPFNITLGGVFWKIVNEDLAEHIEDSSDPSSESYLSVSASWELGFSDYNIVKINGEGKNIEDGEIIAEASKIEEIKENLKTFGGTGKVDDYSVYRLVSGQVVPLGIGLTETPAADVKGVITKNGKEQTLADEEAGYPPDCNPGYEEKDGKCVKVKKEEKTNYKIEKNKSSHNNELNVIIEENYNNIVNKNIMKLTSLKDITDESLKTMEASAVSDFIESELKRQCEEYETEQSKLENTIEESKKTTETLSTENETLKKELEAVKTEVDEMKAVQTAQLAEAKFNERMATLDEEYQLDDDTRKVVAEQLKAMPIEDEDEAYVKWQDTSKVLLKRHSKSFIEEQEKISASEKATEETKEESAKSAQETEKATEETKATTEAEVAVEEAIENAEVEKEEIPNTTDASEPTLSEKYQTAFNLDQFDIKY
jgi:hypothetical protein